MKNRIVYRWLYRGQRNLKKPKSAKRLIARARNERMQQARRSLIYPQRRARRDVNDGSKQASAVLQSLFPDSYRFWQTDPISLDITIESSGQAEIAGDSKGGWSRQRTREEVRTFLRFDATSGEKRKKNGGKLDQVFFSFLTQSWLRACFYPSPSPSPSHYSPTVTLGDNNSVKNGAVRA